MMTSSVSAFDRTSSSSQRSSFFSDNLSPLVERLKKIPLPIPKTADVAANKKLREEYKKELQEMYGVAVLLQNSSNPEEKKEALLLLADLLTKFGYIRYDENYPSCMYLTRASLQAQLVALNVFDSLFFELPEELDLLEAFLIGNDQAFTTFDNFLRTSHIGTLFDKVKEGMTPENLYKMGFTLSWMANSLHHTVNYKEVTQANNLRFNQLYELSIKALEASGTDEAKLEFAEVLYNGVSRMGLRANPLNLAAAHEWLDKAKTLNPSLEMAARVANLKACDYGRLGNLAMAKKYAEEAVAIRASIPKEEQDPFLVANAHSVKAGHFLEEGNLVEAEKEIDLALAYSTACRGERDSATGKLKDQTNDHQYFGFYDFTKAKIKIKEGRSQNLQEALTYLKRALETFMYHEQDSKEPIAATKHLISMIEQALL